MYDANVKKYWPVTRKKKNTVGKKGDKRRGAARRAHLLSDCPDAREREVGRPARLVDVLVQLVQVVAQQLTHDKQVLRARAARRSGEW